MNKFGLVLDNICLLSFIFPILSGKSAFIYFLLKTNLFALNCQYLKTLSLHYIFPVNALLVLIVTQKNLPDILEIKERLKGNCKVFVCFILFSCENFAKNIL